MKQAILTIEVPDDFEKGDCKKCSFYGFRTSNTGASPRWCILGCDYENCPLEIEDVATTHCYLGSPCEYQNKDIRIDGENDYEKQMLL